MDMENSNSNDDLYSPDPQKCLEALIRLRNSVIGSNRQKDSIIAEGIVPRLLQLLSDKSGAVCERIHLESAVILGSLAKGTDQNILALIDLGVVPVILQILLSISLPVITTENTDEKEKLFDRLIEACLKCLKTVSEHSNAPIQTIHKNPEIVQRLLFLAGRSEDCQICVATIFSIASKTAEEQSELMKGDIVETLACQLDSESTEVQLPTLSYLANICYQNKTVSTIIANVITGKGRNLKKLPVLLGELMCREKSSLVQLEAARCISYMHRAGALTTNDPTVIFRALPCLVRLCHEDQSPKERIIAAETLSHFIEVDTELQRIASISNHLIPSLIELLGPHPEVQDSAISQDMREIAFRAFSSLGSNDKEIGNKIIETENFMDFAVAGLQDPGGPRVRFAALQCLRSLSPSVQQVRPTFHNAVWQPLMKLLDSADKGLEDRGKEKDDRLTVALSTLVDYLR